MFLARQGLGKNVDKRAITFNVHLQYTAEQTARGFIFFCENLAKCVLYQRSRGPMSQTILRKPIGESSSYSKSFSRQLSW